MFLNWPELPKCSTEHINAHRTFHYVKRTRLGSFAFSGIHLQKKKHEKEKKKRKGWVMNERQRERGTGSSRWGRSQAKHSCRSNVLNLHELATAPVG